MKGILFWLSLLALPLKLGAQEIHYGTNLIVPGKVIEFLAPLNAQGQRVASSLSLTNTSARGAFVAPASFTNLLTPCPLLIISVPSGGSAISWLPSVTNAALSGGWAVLAADGPKVNAKDDTIQFGWAMLFSVLEEFHRTWKTGGCKVEDTQLRSRDAVIRWATILAVVAARIERLKRLGRQQPERPASDELSAVEIEVLLVLKRRQKKRTEHVPDGVPTMAQATRWIADLGGYTGKSSGGPPGSITIGRGLERLLYGVEAVLALRAAEK